MKSIRFVPGRAGAGSVGARKLAVTRERVSDMASRAGAAEKKNNGEERDIFCAVRDAFRSLRTVHPLCLEARGPFAAPFL